MLDKAIQYKKEKRRPYYTSARFDYTCRNHGKCSWCKNNRIYSSKKRESACKFQIEEIYLSTKEEEILS